MSQAPIVQMHSSEWLHAIDRGGLWHVSHNTFLFFCTLEEVVRAYLRVSNIKELSTGMKSTIIQKVIDNGNVNFHWCLVAVEADKQILLEKIVNHWVTTGAHEQKERATYSANTLIINDVLPLYLSMNVRHIYLTRITSSLCAVVSSVSICTDTVVILVLLLRRLLVSSAHSMPIELV